MYIVNVELNGNIVKAQSIHYSSKTKMYLVKGDVFDIGENKDGFYDIFYRAKNDNQNA